MAEHEYRQNSQAELDAVVASYLEALDRGEQPDQQALIARYPHLAQDLESYFANQHLIEPLAQQLRDDSPQQSPATVDSLPEAASGHLLSQPDTPTQHSQAEARTATGQGAGVESGERFGDYEILSKIEEGGMGVVYRARHVPLDRLVALKKIKAEELASHDLIRRFHAEAEAAANLDHPHIVPIYEVGEHQGQHFFSMKLIQGTGLNKIRNRYQHDPRSAARLLAQVAGAVHHAHQRGILHRDLKPGNILVDAEGQPHVTDFGLAKRLEGEGGQTRTGAIVGTPEFMSPEQATAQKDLTTATDVWGLGAIFYALLTGKPPFRGDNVLETLRLVVDSEPIPPRTCNPRVDRDLETIGLKCLHKDPQKRYGSAEALAGDLQRFLAGEPILARPVGRGERLVKWARRSPALASLVVVSLLAVGFLVSGAIYFTEQLRLERNDALAQKTRADAEAREARAQRTRADTNARQAQKQADAERKARRRTEVLLYANQLTQADNASLAGEHTRSNQILDECKEHQRGWVWNHLRRGNRTARPILTLPGHAGPVLSTCFSPDGTRIATAGGEGTVKVWNARTGQEVLELEGHSAAVESVAFSPDGKRLATASHDRTVGIWDASTGSRLFTLKRHTDVVRSVAFSPDGIRLASASTDHTVCIWDVHRGELLLHFKRHTPDGISGWLASVAFDATGSRIVSAGRDRAGSVRIWNPFSGAEFLRFFPHNRYVYSACFSPDGTKVATGGTDHLVRITHAGQGTRLLTLRGHTDVVRCVTYHPDGRSLASASLDRTVKVWDAATGEQLVSIPVDTGPVFSVSFSPDGDRLVTGSEIAHPTTKSSPRGEAKVWDLRRDAETMVLRRHTGPVTGVAFHPDGRFLASASSDTTVILWDGWTGQPVRSLRAHQSEVQCVTFDHQGNRLASADNDGVVKLWNLSDQDSVLSLKGHQQPILCAAFSPDDSKLATGSQDRTVKVWDTATGNLLFSLQGHTSTIHDVAFDGEGKRLATASGDNTVHVWDGQSGKELLRLEGHTAAVRAVAFSPDGNRLASAGLDNQVRLWDLQSGQEVLSFRGHKTDVLSVCFSPDGRQVVSAGGGKDAATDRLQSELTVWNAVTGIELLSLQGHKGPIGCVRFSHDGTRIASAGADRTIRLWKARPRADESSSADWWTTVAWHAQEADRAEEAKRGGAAIFHLQRLPQVQLKLARLCLDSGDRIGYRERCKALCSFAEQANDPALFRATSWTCVLAPDGLDDYEKLLDGAHLQVASRGDLQARRILGGLLLRSGKPSEAIVTLKQALAARAEQGGAEELLLALAYQQMGQSEEAKRWLQQANAWLEQPRPPDARPGEGLRWLDLRLLRREARDALEPIRITDANRKQRLEEAIAALEKHGATFTRDDSDRIIGIQLVHGLLNDDDLRNLIPLQDLRSIEFRHCENIAGAGLKYLQELPNLKELYLEGRYGDVTLQQLKELTQLETLHLYRQANPNVGIRSLYRQANRLSDAGVGALSGLTRLKELRLESGTRFTNGRLIDMSGRSRVPVQGTRLRMWVPTAITDSGMRHLVRMKDLEKLSLDSSPSLSDAGVAKISNLSSLKQLSLGCSNGSRFTNATLAHLPRLPNLTSLDLTGAGITDAGLPHLRHLPRLKVLRLDHCAGISDTGLEYLKDLKQLEVLTLNKTNSTDAGLAHLQGLEHLRELHLQRTRITDQGIEYLQRLPQLQILNLALTKISDNGLKHLGSIHTLRSLNLNQTDQLRRAEFTHAGLIHLKGLQQLEELYLLHNPITDEELRHISGLTRLRVLHLAGNARSQTKITNAGLPYLRKLTNLEELSLPAEAITDAGLAPLGKMIQLKALTLYYLYGQGRITDAGLAHLNNLKHLESLHIVSQRVTGSGLRYLATLPKLRDLDLYFNPIHIDRGLNQLKNFGSLRYVNLEGNEIGDRTLKTLRHQPYLTRLRFLFVSTITDDGSQYLHTLPSLRFVDLRATGTTASGINRLRQAFPDPPVRVESVP